MNCEYAKGITMAAAEREYDRICKEADVLAEQHNKVIIYEIHLKGYVAHPGGKGEFLGCRSLVDRNCSYGGDNPIGITVAACVADETVLAQADKGLQRTYKRIESSLPEWHKPGHIPTWGTFDKGGRAQNIIDWTPEREIFFKELIDSLEFMLIKVEEFMEPDNILKVIDSHARLLPPPADKQGE